MSARMQRWSYQSNEGRARPKWTVVALGLALAACSRGGSAWHPADAPPPPNSEESGYLKPPLVLGAARAADGTVVLSGHSGPQVRVRLSSPPPNSVAYGATANDRGDWSVATPAANDVRLYGLAEELVGRDVQGEGYIVVLPGSGPAAALLRAGGGAWVVAPPPGVRITAVDYDGSGAAVISGLGKPGTVARLSLDGAAAGEARVNDRGRFSISLSASIRPGDHLARIDSQDQSVSVKFDVDPPKPVSGLPYRGEHTGAGWRVDWLTPGGGEQTTLIFDTAES